MRVLFCNPVFFEYRLPFYKELAELFKKEFYVLYSPVRFKICGKEKLCKQVKEEMKECAIELTTDHLFDTNSKRWDVMPDIEKGKRIPLTWGLMRAIGKVKPDVLITVGYFQWTPVVLLYGLLHRIPVYLEYERTCWTERYAGKMKICQRKLFNRFFAGFIVNGSETRKYLMSLGVESDRIHIGGMSAGIVSHTDSADKADRSKILKEKKGLTFLFSGAIAERKGVIHLLDAWRVHIKSHQMDTLVLVGDGNQMSLCREMAKDLPSVRFEGHVPYDRMGDYYASADVYILPTTEDNWSLVIPEAMQYGLPVATSIYNGCHPELVKEGMNGYTFDTFRHETIVEVLDRFHHADLKAMGEASVRLEEPFNTENSARRVYNAIIGEK